MIAEPQTQCSTEIRVFIIEDETLLRELYSEYVLVLGNYKIIGSCEDGSVALKRCLEAKPDVVILDLCLPEVSGLEILVLLKRKLPGIKVVISQSLQEMALAGECLPFRKPYAAPFLRKPMGS